MGNWFKNSFDYSFKTKKTRDSSGHSNESPRSRDFIRASSFSQSQYREDTTSPCPSELSDHSSADFRPSQQKVRLKNGSEVLAEDILSIMNSLQEMKKEVQNINAECGMFQMFRIKGRYLYHDMDRDFQDKKAKKAGLEKALDELEAKCKNSNHKIEDKYCKLLQEKDLINEHSGQPSDSVRNIVLSMSLSNSGDGSPVAEERVKLKNGAEEDSTLVKTVMPLLRLLRVENPEALSDLHKSCQDQNYILDHITTEVLKAKNLINKDTGKTHKAIKNIVLSSFDEKSGELRSPAMPLGELEKKVLENVQKKIADKFLVLRALENKMGDPGRAFMPFKDNVEKIKEEIKKEFFEDKEALKFIYPNQSDDY